MQDFTAKLGHAAIMAAGMFWDVGWSLVLGFALSGVIQALVPQDRIRAALGRNGLKEVLLATGFGAASSSCSYASAAVMKTLFKKGAALVPSLAFLLASTNLVIELGIILYLLMGWQFTAAEWIGGLVLIALMAALVRLTYPARLVDEARRHPDPAGGHDHGAMAAEPARVRIARNFAMDLSMLWKDLVAGFLIAGLLSAFVPADWWATLFLKHAAPWVQIPANALIGPLIAVLSFVCSIGNVPMAAILWSSGIGFGGVLAFLYADLIVLPLLDVYRRYYGWKMALYIAGTFFVAMVLAALVMDLAFTAAGWVPRPNPDLSASFGHFSLNYTFWLNLGFGMLAAYLLLTARRHPMAPAHHHH
jgi:uncharacterized protein